MHEPASWIPAYIGLGSNLDDPPAQLARALAALARLPSSRLVAASGFYRNPPLGPQDQPWYVNAVAALLTRLGPQALLVALKGIEAAQGRQRRPDDRWGPRVVDLDLLLYGSLRVDEPGLVVPHPGIAERNFVLFPLLEIAPAVRVPGRGRAVELARSVDGTSLECVRPASADDG